MSCLKICLDPKLFMPKFNCLIPREEDIEPEVPEKSTLDSSIDHAITYPAGEVPKTLVSILQKYRTKKVTC